MGGEVLDQKFDVAGGEELDDVVDEIIVGRRRGGCSVCG